MLACNIATGPQFKADNSIISVVIDYLLRQAEERNQATRARIKLLKEEQQDLAAVITANTKV